MKNKRIPALALAALLLVLTACGGAPQSPPSQPTATPTPALAELRTLEPTAQPVSETDAPSTPEGDVSETDAAPEKETPDWLPVYGEAYYDLVNVVLYLELYGELPVNYITKNEARKYGWTGGSVEDYVAGAAIGGDSFGNREGLLPQASGRRYTECDIDTDGYYSRGSRRLVFSNDGLYFYTSDHYENFSEVTVTENYEVIW